MPTKDRLPPIAIRFLGKAVILLVAMIFAGVASAGIWHLLARVLPMNSEAVTLVEWDQVSTSGNPRWGTGSGESSFFELKDSTGKVDRISVPPAVWERRIQMSRAGELTLERSRLGGLPVSLSFDNTALTSTVIPEGGVLQQLLEGTEGEPSAAAEENHFDLLIPIPGALSAAVLGFGIWCYMAARLGFRRDSSHPRRAEIVTFGLGSLVGVIGSILWLG